MSTFFKVVAYALITLFLGVILREVGFRGSRLVTILGTVSVIGAAALSLDALSGLIPQLDGANEYSVAMLKMIGIGYASGICADVCSELGETGVGRALITASKIEIAVIAMPFFKELIEIGKELFGG